MCKECNCYNGPPVKQTQYVKDTGIPHLDEEIIFSLLLLIRRKKNNLTEKKNQK